MFNFYKAYFLSWFKIYKYPFKCLYTTKKYFQSYLCL